MSTRPGTSHPYDDFEPEVAGAYERHAYPRRSRRRALHPAALTAAAALAVLVASGVGALTFLDGTKPAAAIDRDEVPAAADALVAGPGAATGPGSVAESVSGLSVGGSATTGPAATPTAAATTGAARPPAPPAQAAPAKTAPAVPKPADPTVETEVLTLVNAERAKVGCKPVTADSRLATAARLHSQDMATRNFFDHTNPDGVTFDKRITNAGYRWSSAGENIAKGQQTPADVMKSWMNSPGHRANILNCGYRNLGVGVAYQGRTPIWTQDFASPA